MENRKAVGLEATVMVGGRYVIPIWTMVVFQHGSGTRISFSMVKEALGVIVCRDGDRLVLMADGRQLTLEELVAEYPELSDPVGRL